MFQVSVEEMVTKKEQIAEALRATQMMLNKHSEKWVKLLSPTYKRLCPALQVFSLACLFPFVLDRMTEEEREKAQEQLMALSQAYSELSQQCSDQTTAAEEVWTQSVWRVLIRNSATCWSDAWLTILLSCVVNEQLSFTTSYLLLAYYSLAADPKHDIYNWVCCKHALLCPALIWHATISKNKTKQKLGF